MWIDLKPGVPKNELFKLTYDDPDRLLRVASSPDGMLSYFRFLFVSFSYSSLILLLSIIILVLTDSKGLDGNGSPHQE